MRSLSLFGLFRCVVMAVLAGALGSLFLLAGERREAVAGEQKITRKTELSEKTYSAVLEALRKLPVKTHWKEIPWRPNLGEAIEEARREDKPILLWMMNGHPCGMT